MELFFILLLVGLVGLAFYVLSVYNGLQTLKTQIEASVQEIGNQLKRQASLIPSLQTSAKAYLKHEKSIFEELTSARKTVEQADQTGNSSDIEAAVNQLQSIVPKLQVMVEDNPELKADQTITRFMDELRDTADKLMYARRSVIDLTQNYNQKLVVFPSNIVASTFGFTEEKGIETSRDGGHLETSSEEMKDPEIKF